MNFIIEKEGVLYGYVKGTSMWPAFIPGDILKSERVLPADLNPGDIIVLNHRSNNPIVHRLISINRGLNSSIEFYTAGDRGGLDTPSNVDAQEELLRVVGVLRKRRWKIPSERVFTLASIIPRIIVIVHCKLVRKLFW